MKLLNSNEEGTLLRELNHEQEKLRAYDSHNAS
jgi:hypothetical protein